MIKKFVHFCVKNIYLINNLKQISICQIFWSVLAVIALFTVALFLGLNLIFFLISPVLYVFHLSNFNEFVFVGFMIYTIILLIMLCKFVDEFISWVRYKNSLSIHKKYYGKNIKDKSLIKLMWQSFKDKTCYFVDISQWGK